MEAERGAPDQPDLSEAMPERWETTVEDLAQLVGVALDRAQDLADVVNDLARTRPDIMKVVAAGTMGAVVGVLLAGLTRRRREATIPSPRGNSVTHDRSSRGLPVPTSEGRRQAVQLSDAAELLPIAVTILGNPVVRRVLLRVAMRVVRRR